MEHIANCGDFKVVEEFKLPFENFKYNFDEKRIFAADIPRARNRPPSISTRSPPPPSSSQSPPSSLLPSSSLKKPLLSAIREEDGGGGKEEGWRREDEDERREKEEGRREGRKQEEENEKGDEWGWEEEEIDRVRMEVKEFRRRINENNWFYVVEQGKEEDRDEERKIN